MQYLSFVFCWQHDPGGSPPKSMSAKKANRTSTLLTFIIKALDLIYAPLDDSEEYSFQETYAFV
jgi:hypothetical protein